MRYGQRHNCARDLAHDALSAGEIGRRVAAARTSVTERYRSGYDRSNPNWQDQGRSAPEAPVQIRDAAARRRLPVVMNASPQRRPSGANDLGDGALQVVAANPVDPLQRP